MRENSRIIIWPTKRPVNSAIQPQILSTEESALWRQSYVDAFVDTACECYQQHVSKPRKFSDGVHHEGYLWDCLRDPVRITYERFCNEITRYSEIYVIADDHSRDRVLGAPLWPYPSYSVAQFNPALLLESLESLPEDIYVFDSSLKWTLVLTHEHDGKRRICCSVGIAA